MKELIKKQLYALEIPEENSLELHVYGDILPLGVYRRMLEIMRERKGHTKIRLVACKPITLLLLREAFPRDSYESIRLSRPTLREVS